MMHRHAGAVSRHFVRALLLALATAFTGLCVRAQPAQNAPPLTDRYGDTLPDGAFVRLGTVRFRHDWGILSLAVAPDGKSIASGGGGRAVRLWDVATGKKLRYFPYGYNEVLGVAFSPDGKSLAFTSHPNVHLCEIATGKELHRFTGNTNTSCSVAFSPDGRLLSSVGYDENVRLWDTATGKELAVGQGHEGMIWKVAFFPDGKTLASAGSDKTVRIWEAATGTELARLEGHQGEVYSLAIAPDGKTLASAGQDKTVRLWDVAAGKELRVFAGHQGDIHAVVFSPNGKTLASGCYDNTIRFWDVATGKELRRIEGLKSFARALAFLPDGRTLASGGLNHSAVQFWDVATGKEVGAKVGHEGHIWSLGFAADDRTLFSTSADQTCRVWTANGEEVRRVEVGIRAGISPDGKLVAGWTGPLSAIRLWDVTTGEEQCPFEEKVESASRLIFSPDNKVIASICNKGKFVLWEVSTGRQVPPFGGEESSKIFPQAFTPDGTALLALDRMAGSNPLCLWDLATGKELRRFPTWVGNPSAAGFSPNGKTLATVGAEEEEPIRLWDVASGTELYQLSGEAGRGSPLTFSSDGRLLASAGRDKTVHVWELGSTKRVKVLRGLQDEVGALAFSHDGTTLATGSGCEILLWDLTGLRNKEGRLAELHPSPEQLEATWRDLGGMDGPAAFQAFWRLTASPRETTAFLGERLMPVAAADAARIARLIADLDSEQFTVRDAAVRELEQLAERAEPALRKLLAGQPSPEARRRAEMLVRQLEGPILPRERLQQERALAALERIGSPDVRQVFTKLAEGAPDAWLTQQARTALDRRNKASASTP
jgi:WD40 repeat protein